MPYTPPTVVCVCVWCGSGGWGEGRGGKGQNSQVRGLSMVLRVPIHYETVMAMLLATIMSILTVQSRGLGLFAAGHADASGWRRARND